jgi:superfamily II DNA or RNA helicase
MDANPIEGLAFRYPWRPYQERVLKAINLHLADRKLHVVAAPGAGKTTLGKPALVLSPTRSIRDQWIFRLADFVQDPAGWPAPWVGSDIENLGFFTSITYQALHTKYRDGDEHEDDNEKSGEEDGSLPPGEDELKLLIKRLKNANIGTLILDEAHHLRAEWWKALTTIVGELPDIILVSLTATPPYDVIGIEWDKYQELCGPIDEEISVPELVKAGTLCPHQDYVWLVKPPEKESERLKEYDESVDRLSGDLLHDEVFKQNIKAHPWLVSDKPDDAEILDAPELAVAMMAYLRTVGESIPSRLCSLLDCRDEDIPTMGRRWWQVLVRSYLFDQTWPKTQEVEKHRDHLAKRLRAESLLWRRELRLSESRPVARKLSLSPSKIQACIDIHRQELALHGDRLRQVILTDFIRDDDIDKFDPPGTPLLGAWPVFRALVRQADTSEYPCMALLTGRLAVIHDSLLTELEKQLRGEKPVVEPVDSLSGFSRISLVSGNLTQIFTALLASGRIRTLTATRSLLGEGWDAPVINSLVLCSFVGSFMLTNQMRGRAIRIDKNCPDKVSSIWHLVAVDTRTPSGLTDIEELQRRFLTFVGVAAKEILIENGLDRMALDFIRDRQISPRHVDVDRNNGEMIARLKADAELRGKWKEAIDKGSEGRVIPAVSMEKPLSIRAFHFFNTLRYLIYQAIFAFFAGAGYVAQGSRTSDLQTLLWLIIIASGAGFVFALPKLIKALILLIRHYPVDGAVRQIAIALRDALCAAQLIETDPRRLPVQSEQLKDGSCMVSLGGADFFEQSLFADCLGEVLGPIENPRYLITRHSLGRWIGKVDYHAVPQVLGVTKERAELFCLAWQKRVSAGKLIYTRSAETRKVLLKARARAFSSAIAGSVNRLDRWQ